MSWKKYGGIKQLNKANFLNVNSVVTDTLTLRNNYDGNFQIDGSLFVYPDLSAANSSIGGNLDVSGDLEVGGDVTFRGDINPNNVNISTFLNVDGVSELKDKVFFDGSRQTFLLGKQTNIGINTEDPVYLWDVHGSQEKMASFVTSTISAESILLQNTDGYGFSLSVDNSYNTLRFDHQNSNAYIQHDSSGNMIHSTGKSVQLHTEKLFLKKDGNVNTNDESTVVFHDSRDNSNVFLSHVDLSDNTTTGVGLKLVSNNASSNVFMKTVTTENRGWNYGGGAFFLDTSRNMGTMGWTDICSANYVFDTERFIPSQMIVSGSSLVNTRATTGFNTFDPSTEEYVVDMNGPMKMRHNEIHETAVMPFVLNTISMSKNDNFTIASGESYYTPDGSSFDYYFLLSDSKGTKWDKKIETSPNQLSFDAFVCDSSFSTVYTDQANIYYFQQFSRDFANVDSETLSYSKRFIFKYDDKYRVFVFVNSTVLYYIDFRIGDNGSVDFSQTYDDLNGIPQTYNSDPNIPYTRINSVDGITQGNGGTFYMAGSNSANKGSIYQWVHNKSSPNANTANSLLHTNTNISAYVSIKNYNTHLVAVGENYITTSDDLFSSNSNDFSFPDPTISLNDVFILDGSCAVVVGTNASIYVSNDYLNGSWRPLTKESVDSMGNADSLFDPNNNIKTVHMDGSYNFIFGCVVRASNYSDDRGESKIFHCYFPNVFYPEEAPSLLYVEGNVDINRTLDIGKLTIQKEPTLEMSMITDTYDSSSNGTVDLSKSIVIGDANTRIDIIGYLNLIDLSATNIKGGGGGTEIGSTDMSGISSTEARDIIASTTSLPKLNNVPDLSGIPNFKNTNIERTSSKYFFVNYDGSYNEIQTAGSGFYIYNDISFSGGITVDQQLRDGYIRISKYKVDSTSPQDSFSFRATGKDKAIRLNVEKIATSTIVSSGEKEKKPLLFANYLERGDIDIDDATYNARSTFEDDDAEIAADGSKIYIDGSGNLFTQSVNVASGKLLAVEKIVGVDGAAIDFSENIMNNVAIRSGDISGTDILVGVDKTLDVSAGTFVTSASQNLAILEGAGSDIDFGLFDLCANTFTSKSLTDGRVVFSDADGKLVDNANMTFSTNTLTVAKLGAFTATGAIDFGNQAMTNVDINSGDIDGVKHGTTANRVLYTTTDGVITSEGGFTYDTDTLTVSKLGAFTATGAIDFDNQAMTNVNINSGDIDGVKHGTTANRVLYTTTGGEITSESEFTYDATSNKLTTKHLELSSTGSDIVVDVSGLQFTAAKVAEALQGGFNGGDLSANNADFSGNVLVKDNLTVDKILEFTSTNNSNVITINGTTYKAIDFERALLGGGGGGGGSATIKTTSDFYGANAYFTGDVFVTGTINFGVNLTVTTASGETNILTLDNIDAGDASFNGVYVEDILTLNDTGGNTVLDVSGIQFTASEVAEVLSGGGGGFKGGDLSANNADFSGNVSISDKLVIGGSGEILDTEGVLTVVSNTVYEKAFVIKTARNDGYVGHNRLWFSTNLGTSSYNEMTLSGDFGLFFNDDDYRDSDNGLVIAPWSDTSGASDADTVPVGIRISNHGIELGTNAVKMFKRGTTTQRLALVADYPDILTINYSGNNVGDYYTGGVQIGKASNPVPFIINGTCTILQRCSATSFNSTSDYRVKSNIESLTIRENTIDHLRPVQYTLNSSGETQFGFIAHELQEHYPELVSGTKDGEEMQQINYVGMIPVLVKEIQQLRQRVSKLESQL